MIYVLLIKSLYEVFTQLNFFQTFVGLLLLLNWFEKANILIYFLTYSSFETKFGQNFQATTRKLRSDLQTLLYLF